MVIKRAAIVVSLGMLLGMPVADASTPINVVAVGDIATFNGGQSQTAALTKNLAPDKVFLLGDLAYQNGSNTDFRNYFLPYWRPLLAKSWAVPGNHEYGTYDAQGYRNLVNDFKLPRTGDKLWWSKKLGSWTVIGLNSETVWDSLGAAQLAFLKATLKSNNKRPTIVMWHRPRISRGEHGNQADTNGLWSQVSKDPDVKLVLWGHDHNYEQVNRVISRGKPNQHTVTTIVVGTGGAELRECNTPNIAGQLICGRDVDFGVLNLKLAARSFTWSYRQADGTSLGNEQDFGRVSW